MTKQHKTKVERTIILVERGATTAAIVKALNVSPQYVYNVRSRINKRNKEAETITPTPVQLELKIEPTPIVQQPVPEYLNSIQGEYSKQQEMTTWQRIKAAIGF